MKQNKRGLYFGWLYYCMLFIVFITVVMCAYGCTQQVENPKISKKEGGYGASIISYSNNKVLYVYVWGAILKSDYSVLAEYDLSTKTYRIIGKMNDYYGSPIYSRDGKKIAYAHVKVDSSSNICIMDADGSNIRQLTHDYNDKAKRVHTPTGSITRVVFNASPSFSPDGKRIIFMRATIKRKHIRTGFDRYSGWDVYELDIATGAIRRLTVFRFYEMSRPFYLSDGKRFIFSAKGPASEDRTFEENYRKEYQNNTIFIMDGVHNALRPALVHGKWSSAPSVTNDDTILFVSVSNEMDGFPDKPVNFDLFLKKGNKITRVTKNQGYRFIMYPSISFDGKRILFIAAKHVDRKNTVSKYIVNNDGTGLTRVVLPGIMPGKE